MNRVLEVNMALQLVTLGVYASKDFQFYQSQARLETLLTMWISKFRNLKEIFNKNWSDLLKRQSRIVRKDYKEPP